jgi:hypothetical protein
MWADRHGASEGLPTVRACADSSLHCAFGNMSRVLALVMVPELAKRSTTSSVSVNAAFSDGRHCE